MKVKQVMLENPRTLYCSQTLLDACQLYRRTKVNCAPVVDDQENVVGILTVFQMLEAIEAGATFDTQVGQVMDKNLHIIDEDTSYRDISRQPIERLLIFNKYQKLTGVLTRIDLINKVHKALENTENQLAEVSENNQLLNSIVEASYDGIIVIDHLGRIQRVNTSYFRVLDSPHDPSGETIENLNVVCKDQVIQVYHEVITKGKVAFNYFQGTNLLELTITGCPVFDEQSLPALVVITIRDFTELNQLKVQSARFSQELKLLRAREQKDLIYQSPAMEQVVNQALRVSEVDSTVLITGESGVGKEVVARMIHRNSNRAEGPFIQINCGAIPDSLLESELFGYEKGAFTGANKDGKPGMMELANKGTLLLDEVGDLPLNLQVKLLRALQEQVIYRIGGRVAIKLDVRIIAATNKNLEDMILKNEFREDLFYRLNVVPIYIPPLRERHSDILPLVMHFLDKFNYKYKLKKRFSTEACKIMEEYSWPGNIRELANIVERLVIMSETETIFPEHLRSSNLVKQQSNPLQISVQQIIPLKTARDLLESKLILKHGAFIHHASLLNNVSIDL